MLTVIVLHCSLVRECGRDYTYKGINIPKGTEIPILGYLMHMNPEYWKEPEKFDPLRYEQGAPGS